mgnify:CR=1 FL=1
MLVVPRREKTSPVRCPGLRPAVSPSSKLNDVPVCPMSFAGGRVAGFSLY